MNLKTFNFYQYVREKIPSQAMETFFYADHETYRNLKMDFPFRTTHFGIGISYGEGVSSCRLGSVVYELSEGSLTTVGPGIVTCWDDRYDLKNETVFFTEELLRHLKVPVLSTLPFFIHGGNHMLKLSSVELENFRMLFQNIKTFRENKDVLPGLVFSLVQLVQQLHRFAPKENGMSQKEQLTGKFKKLIGRHFIESKEVGFYASQLNITPKYLSEVLEMTTGKTAKELINEHIFLEARSLLKQTPLTVKEIAYWLGFEDQSYFVRAFKKQVGTTPADYRNQDASLA